MKAIQVTRARKMNMGLFGKKTQKPFKHFNPLFAEKISLRNRIMNDFYPHTNESFYFFDLAFPETVIKSQINEYHNWAPQAIADFEAQEIKELLHSLENDEITIHELTKLVYGFNTFEEFVDHIQDELKQSTAEASDSTLKKLKSEHLSPSWLEFIKSGPIEPNVSSWLFDLGDRMSTHSAVGSLYGVLNSELRPYAKAASLGFRTVNYVLKKNKYGFHVINSPDAGKSFVNDCIFFRGTAINPLDVLNESAREVVESIIDGLENQLQSMLGTSPTTSNHVLTSAPVPFRISLMAAANGGAMMACIGADASGCRFYEGSFFDRQLQPANNRAWYKN
jgi:hypothetical protein